MIFNTLDCKINPLGCLFIGLRSEMMELCFICCHISAPIWLRLIKSMLFLIDFESTWHWLVFKYIPKNLWMSYDCYINTCKKRHLMNNSLINYYMHVSIYRRHFGWQLIGFRSEIMEPCFCDFGVCFSK